MKHNAQCNVEFEQGVAEQKNWTIYEDVGREGDLGLSQVKEVGNLSESCISQKKLEVKLETAVNNISEKDSRVFLVLQKTCILIWEEKENGNVVNNGLFKDRNNYNIFETMP